MSDSFGDITRQNQSVKTVCRVAYTINGVQPVISTIIDDQPLFYMDFNYSYEDEEDMRFDAADIGILESEICALKNEIGTIERLSKNFVRESDEKVEEFLDDASFMTNTAQIYEECPIENLIEILRESRLATAYLACAEKYDVNVKYSAQIETAQYDRNAGLILVNPNLDIVDQQLITVQELRRHWQHRQGVLIHPLMFHPDNAILVNRAQVADLVVSMIRVAWELQLSGEKEVWERIENSSMADLGRAFAREAFLDFRTINNGQAAAAVFEAWFLSERCRAQDKVIINQMLADYKGYVFDLKEAEQNITPSLIAALGEMPFGKNYLAEHAVTIMEDAIFTDVRDRSNANFLWFIKFERSFRESEQELQTSAPSSAGDIRFSASYLEGVQDHAFTGQSAQVISLFTEECNEAGDKSGKDGGRLAPKPRPKRTNNKSEDSNIVYIRRFPTE